MRRAINIWRLSDGRAGHDNQSLGLVEALARKHPLEAFTINVNSAWHGARQVLARGTNRPRPALIIGAGHATHAGLIVGAWRYRARSIVLMSPSLPHALFDLCIVPEHDGVRPRSNVLHSFGALNRVQVSTERDPTLALILLGGPSKHHQWQQDEVLNQVRALVSARTTFRWLVASSPRTPAQAIQALSTLDNVQLMRFKDTGPDWLPKTLARAALVWVSEDSVSMVYEALSSGAPTGLLHVSALNHKHFLQRNPAGSRLVKAVQALRDSGRIIDTQQWLAGLHPPISHGPLREADRCAEQILERWPDLH